MTDKTGTGSAGPPLIGCSGLPSNFSLFSLSTTSTSSASFVSSSLRLFASRFVFFFCCASLCATSFFSLLSSRLRGFLWPDHAVTTRSLCSSIQHPQKSIASRPRLPQTHHSTLYRASIMPRLTLAVFLFAASALAQTYAVIDYTKVPSCAKQCTVLTSAESACIPPTQPVTSQNSYQACFCASSSLSGLYASSQAVCSNVCTSTADQQQLANWYVNLCTSGIVVTPAAAVVTVSSTPTDSQTGSAAQATGTGSSSGQSSGSTSGGGSNSW